MPASRSVCKRLRRSRRLRFALLLVLLATAFAFTPSAARSQVTTAQRENAVLSATVTSVESSLGGNGWHYLTTSVHFQNLSKQPLVLGVEPTKVSSTDDRGNTYEVFAVRGIGEVAGTRVDPKFVLPVDGGGDALFELRWRGTAIFGTQFDLKLPVRVILPLEAGQYKLGTEHLMTFAGLKSGHLATPKGAQPLPENTVLAGPFTVQITRMTPSKAGNNRIYSATMAARIKNTSTKPLVLAYVGSSSFGVDDQGNRFASYDTSVSGIGIVTSLKADPQLELAPGESRDVQFVIFRRPGRETAGTKLSYYAALVELEVLPGNQIRTVRQYSLAFPRMPGLN